MKKMLLIALALGLVVAMAAPATATDWSARGHIFVGGAIHSVVPMAGPPDVSAIAMPAGGTLNPAGDMWNDPMAWVRMGANLTITARQSEDLYGVLGFNMNSTRWGELGNWDVNNAGSWYRGGQDDGGTLSVLVQEMYIDFRVPPKLPVWLRMGAQPYVIRPWILVNTVGPGITARTTIDPIKLNINAGWAKKWEGREWDCDDIDAFFVDMNIPIGPVSLGGFFWYENFGSWTVRVLDDSGARNTADLWWIGGYADGKIGPVGFQFDFIYGGGDIDGDPDSAAVPPVVDYDVESWIVRGVLDVSPIPRLTVGVGGLYATGEDISPTDPDSEEFMSVNNREGFGRQQGLPALQDFFMVTGGCMGIIPARGPMVAFFGGPVSLGGLWYVRGFAQYVATDWLRLVANFGWLGDTRKHGNKLGTAADPASVSGLRDDDDIGFEVDLGFNIALYKNLEWGVGFSYLFAGDALDQQDPVTLLNEDPNDPWMLQSAILYTF